MDDKTACLLTAFQSGDMKAFSELYDMYIDVLLIYGNKLTMDKELLKDCIHDVFVKFYMKRDEFGNVNNFKSYLFISLKNKIYDEYRKHTLLSDTSIDDISIISESDDIESKYLSAEKTTIENLMINNLLSQLSARQREALNLYYLEEKKYEDICVIMNMNYQSVRNLMHRSITKLRGLAG